MSLALALFCVLGLARNADAAVIVDPDEDSSGVILSIAGSVYVVSSDLGNVAGNSDTIYLTVDAASTMDVNLEATCLVTRDFALDLMLDNNTLEATESTASGRKFSAFYDDVALTEGDHTLTVVAADGMGIATYNITVTGGGSGAPSAVPEPATVTLMATGLLGLIGMRRRRRGKLEKAGLKA